MAGVVGPGVQLLGGLFTGLVFSIGGVIAGGMSGCIAEGLNLPKRTGWVVGTAGVGGYIVAVAKGSSCFAVAYRVGASAATVLWSAALGKFPEKNQRLNLGIAQRCFKQALLYGGITAVAGFYMANPFLATLCASVIAHGIAKGCITEKPPAAAQPQIASLEVTLNQ